MCTVNMTFEVPETKHINIEALKKQMHSYLEFILSMPSLTTKEEDDMDEKHIFDCFDDGGWAEDPRSVHEIANELHAGRVNNIYHDLIVVTHNVKHFDRIPGLQVTDWEK